MKKISFIRMVLLSTLGCTMIANATEQIFRMHNQTSHTLYYSVQCDPGITNSKGMTYSLEPNTVLSDRIHTVRHEEHANDAVCNIAIAPTPDAPAYIQLVVDPYVRRHCTVINPQYLGKQVTCRHLIDMNVGVRLVVKEE